MLRCKDPRKIFPVIMHRSIIAEPTHRRIGGDISSGVCIMLSAWAEHAEKLKDGEITKEDYDRWRYTYPEMEAQRTKQELDVLRTEIAQ